MYSLHLTQRSSPSSSEVCFNVYSDNVLLTNYSNQCQATFVFSFSFLLAWSPAKALHCVAADVGGRRGRTDTMCAWPGMCSTHFTLKARRMKAAGGRWWQLPSPPPYTQSIQLSLTTSTTIIIIIIIFFQCTTSEAFGQYL